MIRASMLLLLLAISGLVHATDRAGAWLSCNRKAPWAYTLLSVEEAEGGGHRWSAEWGAPYAASGAGYFRNGEMVLLGCSSYRGETFKGCDEKKPPVFARLKADDYRRVRDKFTAADIRTGRWLRVPRGTDWNTMARNCEEMVQKLNESAK